MTDASAAHDTAVGVLTSNITLVSHVNLYGGHCKSEYDAKPHARAYHPRTDTVCNFRLVLPKRWATKKLMQMLVVYSGLYVITYS